MAERLHGRRQKDGSIEEWAARIIPRAVAYARTLVARSSDAEDVVHDVLCRLFDHKEYDLIADGDRLLFRSITNACINRTVRRREMLSLDNAFEDGTGWSVVVRSNRSSDPAELAIAQELNTAIEEGLAALPAMQRAALELKSMSYSLNEIAHILNTSGSNAGVLVHRARKTLSEELSPMLSSNAAAGGTFHAKSQGDAP